jgi:antagonist of KipI
VTLHITAAGLFTTVQDLGRVGHQRDGVPAGGAMDRMALRVGNLLVGNADGAAGLEITLLGPSISFDEDTLISVTGADAAVTIDDDTLPAYRAALVPRGATLRCNRDMRGCRSYLAVAGGINVPAVFGSRSTYARAGFGGCDGRALRAGDILPAGTPGEHADRIAQSLRARGNGLQVAAWSAARSLRTRYTERPLVRVIPGAHLERLDAGSRGHLFDGEFRVSASSDRMGYRLEGTELTLSEPLELLSEAVAFGTVQLPPNGQPIILMADRQTTGGYPRLGEIASVDLPIVAQARPGDVLRFRAISLEEAQHAYLQREAELAQARVAVSLTRFRELS